MHAAIVAGGLGTRAAGMTADRIPKALLPVAGRADHFPPDARAAARRRDAGQRAGRPSG